MTQSRRDFLRALSLGTGAVLIGRGWYKPGKGLIVPPDPWNTWPRGLIDIAGDNYALRNLNGNHYEQYLRWQQIKIQKAVFKDFRM
jgi:hypothetical protein